MKYGFEVFKILLVKIGFFFFQFDDMKEIAKLVEYTLKFNFFLVLG
jgi:hypothetical protein